MEKKKLTEEEIQAFLSENLDYLKENNNPYIRYFFKKDKVSYTIYTNGTFLVQGKDVIKDEAKDEHDTPYDFFNTIGADEVGTGDTFGPIVCAAVLVKVKDVMKLKQIGVKDSKKLKDDKIIEIGKYLIDNFNYQISILSNEIYNTISDEYNLNEMKARLHNSNITKLANNVNYDMVVLDQFVSPKKYFEYLGDSAFHDMNFEVRGESKSIAIAAASIIARYIFIKEMEKLESLYNIKIPKGSSKETQEFIDNLKNSNPELLLKISKNNFKNISD